MQNPRLFSLLPEYVATPDSMAIHADGDLILAAPNFADPSKPGCLLKIDKSRKISKWTDVPVSPETGHAFPMGIAFGPDGDLYVCDNQGWLGTPELVFKGRVLRLRIRGNSVVKTTVVARDMEHPNGIRVHGGHMYVTQSTMTRVKDPSGLMMSCVYRFGLDEENVKVTNTPADRNIITTFLTHNPATQYGADGIEFDKQGNLYVGNFGDGAVHKITFRKDGSVEANKVWAQNASQLKATDGMVMDDKGNLFIADFSANAVAKVTPDATVTRIAQSPDTDGLHGELDQPADAMIWRGSLVISCFDLVTGPEMVNTAHEMPATLSELDPR